MPRKERKVEIEQIINDLSNKHKEFTIPAFDIIKLLKEKEGFAIGTKVMTDDTTGMLIVDDENWIEDAQTHRLIVVNALLQEQKDFIQRRRFIIAHEYAHFILHKKETKQFAHRDTSRKLSEEEKEADYFARCLLMPETALRSLLNLDFVKGLSFTTKIMLVSRFFNVTQNKAIQRVKEDLCINE